MSNDRKQKISPEEPTEKVCQSIATDAKDGSPHQYIYEGIIYFVMLIWCVWTYWAKLC